MINVVGIVLMVLFIVIGIILWLCTKFELDDYFPGSGGSYTHPYRWLAVIFFIVAIIIIIAIAARVDGII